MKHRDAECLARNEGTFTKSKIIDINIFCWKIERLSIKLKLFLIYNNRNAIFYLDYQIFKFILRPIKFNKYEYINII